MDFIECRMFENVWHTFLSQILINNLQGQYERRKNLNFMLKLNGKNYFDMK